MTFEQFIKDTNFSIEHWRLKSMPEIGEKLTFEIVLRVGENNKTFSTSYSVGSGHIGSTFAPRPRGYFSSPESAQRRNEWERSVKQFRPDVVDILACMALEAFHSDMSFEEWCLEFGFNESSLSEYPRIHKIWEDCNNARRWLQRVFTPDELDTLSVLTEGY